MAEHRWVLIWFLPSPVNQRAGQGPVYRMDADYDVLDVWMETRSAPKLNSVICDINVGEASMFEVRPQITVKQSRGSGIFLSTLGPLREDELVSLDVDQTDGSEGDLTIGLILERRD